MLKVLTGFFVVLATLMASANVSAQTYGIELHNSLMPASGGMGGASFSQPQDLQSALNGNPATMTLFRGTQFSFGGGLAEATYNIDQPNPLPAVGVLPYSGKSDTPGSLLPNIGVTHETSMLGRPVTLGLGFLSNAGLGVDFRPITNANGTLVSLTALDLATSMAMQVSDRLSVGTTVMVGSSFMTGPFLGISGSQTDYAPRISLGANYDLGNGVSVGGYWQSEKSFNFDNVVFNGGTYQDIDLDHPMNYGIGIANRCLMNGRLLVAADLLYKQYSEADFFENIYDDQLVLQFGTQYCLNDRVRLRAGYAWNEDPTLDQVPGTIGGVIPVGGIPAVQYVQAQFASITQHRLTCGIGISDFMPGVDFDATLGGAFEGSKTFGSTTAAVKSYWIGFGFTWKCGHLGGRCCDGNGGNGCCAGGCDTVPAAAANYSMNQPPTRPY